MPIRVAVGFLVAALSLSPPDGVAQRPVELAYAEPQPHFVAAWAPKKPREAERSAVLVQRVSLELTDVPLDLALKTLTQRAGLNITYSPAVLPVGKRVTIEAGDIAVVTALTEMLFRSGLDVMVDRDGAMALVVCRHPAPRAEILDSGTIVGTVTDKVTGAPIAGATVLVEGTKHSATTNSAGRYRIEGVEPEAYSVRVRYIGYSGLASTLTVKEGEELTADFALEKSVQRLDDVVTTGTIVPTEVKALPVPVTVITEADIDAQRPRTVQELLRRVVPGAVSWDYAQAPYATQFSTRGASTLALPAGQMKVFVDGIEAAWSSQAGIDPKSIERIEVIRGPQAAAVYGSDAIGGVIQIFTKRGYPNSTQPQVEAEGALGIMQSPYAGYGGVLRRQFSGSLRGGGSDLAYNVGAGYSHTDDYLPNGEISAQSSPSMHAGLRLSRGILSIDMVGRYYTQNSPSVFNPDVLDTGFVPFSKPNHTPVEIKNQTFGSRINVAPTTWWQHTVTVGLDTYSQELAQERPRLTTPTDTLLQIFRQGRTKASITYINSLHGRLRSRVEGSLTLGVDHFSLPINQFSTSGAVRTTGSIQVGPGHSISASRTLTKNTGYFAQGQIGVANALFVTGALRAERNSDFGDTLSTPISPRAGVSFVRHGGRITLKVRGSYGRAIRPPVPGQKLGALQATNLTLPNPLLGPERQQGWDFGVDAVLGGVGSVSATYYNQTASDLIQLVLLQTSPLLTQQHQNVGRVKNEGVEIEAGLDAGPIRLKGQYGFVSSRLKQLAPNYAGDLRVGDQSLVTPRHTAGATLTISPSTQTFLSAGLTYVGSWTQYDLLSQLRCFGDSGTCRPTGRDYIVDYPAFVKLNATLSQEITRLISAFISVDNLADRKVHEQTNFFPIVGRITTVGVRGRY